MGTPTRNGVRRWSGRGLLLGAGLGAGWIGATRIEASGAERTVPRNATARTERRDLGASVLATGVIRPRVGAEVTVGSRVSGILRRLYVTVGDRVERGQLLAELDRVEFETQAGRAEAGLARAVSERGFAEDRLQRIRELAERAGATGFEVADAELALEAARAQEQEAAAALQAARIQLGYASIHAPISGVVGSVSTQEGETVAASFAAPAFLTIVDLDRLEVWAYVDETDIGRIEVGQQASFTVDTWPDQPFSGRVTAVRPTAEIRDNVVNYITLIDIDGHAGRVLRPEMTATITITIEGRSGVLAIPNGALRRDSAGSYVLLATRVGVERRLVQVGFRGSDFSEVRAGLQEGDEVVIGSAACLDDAWGER